MAISDAMRGRAVAEVSGAADADWDALYAEQLPRIYNFFRYRVGHRADVEELTAVTFEKAWQARHHYRRDLAGFATWLFTIARHVAVDHFRRVRSEVPLDEATRVATGRTPEDEAVRQSDVQRLAALLAQMPDRERDLPPTSCALAPEGALRRTQPR